MSVTRMSWIGGALAGALSFMATAADAADAVKLRLDWVFGSEHAPIFLALEKGYFKEAGIEVELLPGEGSSVTTKLVGNRDADFGYASADQVLLGASRDLPVVATAVVLQQNPTAFIFRTSQNVKNVETDLYGKTLGIQLKSSTGRQWEAIKKTLKLDPTKLTEVPADGALVTLIASDRIDVGVGFYFNDALKLKATGEDVSWILLEDLGMKMYSTTLLTNAELIAENPDLVARFTKAFMRGWSYAVEHPDEAYEAFVKANPSTDKVYAKLKLPEVLKLTQSPDAQANGLGSSTSAAWNDLQDKLVAMDLLKTRIDVSKAFTNQFLK